MRKKTKKTYTVTGSREKMKQRDISRERVDKMKI